MRTVETIDAEIAQLKAQLAETQGTETEVYTRIVGYYRSLRNWNKGKREEYRHRLTYSTEGEGEQKTEEKPAAEPASQGMLFESREDLRAELSPDDISTYNYFYRKTCPNCPPVKNFMSRLPIEGTSIDVDTEEGMSKAVSYQVLSTPTVGFFDREGRPVRQRHSIAQLSSIFADFSVG